jgi:hypothetical protein
MSIDLQPRQITASESAANDKSHELAHFHDTDIEHIYLNIVGSTKLDTDVRANVIDAEFEDAIDATPSFTITLHDPDWHLLRSGALDEAIDLRIAGIRWYRLNDIQIDGDDFTLVFIVRNAAYMMSHSRPKKVTRRAGKYKPKGPSATRAEFILMLVRAVKRVKIPFYCPQLHKAQKIEPLEDRKVRDTRRESGLPNDGIKIKNNPADEEQISNIEAVLSVGTKKKAPFRAQVGAIMCITQESAARKSATNGQFVGLFQQSKRYGWPATRNPYKDAKAFYDKFIPVVRSNPDGDLGELIDRVQGSGQPGAYNRWRAEAEKTVKQYQGGGGGASLEYRKRYEYEVRELDDGTFENYLATTYRLAEEVNWRAFWVRDALYFMSEEDLFKGRSRVTLSRETPGVENVSAQFSRTAKIQSMTISVRMERWVYPIGTVVTWEKGGNPLNGKWLVTNIRRSVFDQLGEITLSKPLPEKDEPSADIGVRQTGGASVGMDNASGAKGIVEQAVVIAKDASNGKAYVGSDYRPGSTTTSGNPSDHSENSARQAARDIGIPGIDLISGPPSPLLDKAVVAIGDAFGRNYGNGKKAIVDTFHWNGYRVQIIWRTPAYGGHMGHIHIGVKAEGASIKSQGFPPFTGRQTP